MIKPFGTPPPTDGWWGTIKSYLPTNWTEGGYRPNLASPPSVLQRPPGAAISQNNPYGLGTNRGYPFMSGGIFGEKPKIAGWTNPDRMGPARPIIEDRYKGWNPFLQLEEFTNRKAWEGQLTAERSAYENPLYEAGNKERILSRTLKNNMEALYPVATAPARLGRAFVQPWYDEDAKDTTFVDKSITGAGKLFWEALHSFQPVGQSAGGMAAIGKGLLDIGIKDTLKRYSTTPQLSDRALFYQLERAGVGPKERDEIVTNYLKTGAWPNSVPQPNFMEELGGNLAYLINKSQSDFTEMPMLEQMVSQILGPKIARAGIEGVVKGVKTLKYGPAAATMSKTLVPPMEGLGGGLSLGITPTFDIIEDLQQFGAARRFNRMQQAAGRVIFEEVTESVAEQAAKPYTKFMPQTPIRKILDYAIKKGATILDLQEAAKARLMVKNVIPTVNAMIQIYTGDNLAYFFQQMGRLGDATASTPIEDLTPLQQGAIKFMEGIGMWARAANPAEQKMYGLKPGAIINPMGSIGGLATRQIVETFSDSSTQNAIWKLMNESRIVPGSGKEAISMARTKQGELLQLLTNKAIGIVGESGLKDSSLFTEWRLWQQWYADNWQLGYNPGTGVRNFNAELFKMFAMDYKAILTDSVGMARLWGGQDPEFMVRASIVEESRDVQRPKSGAKPLIPRVGYKIMNWSETLFGQKYYYSAFDRTMRRWLRLGVMTEGVDMRGISLADAQAIENLTKNPFNLEDLVGLFDTVIKKLPAIEYNALMTKFFDYGFNDPNVNQDVIISLRKIFTDGLKDGGPPEKIKENIVAKLIDFRAKLLADQTATEKAIAAGKRAAVAPPAVVQPPPAVVKPLPAAAVPAPAAVVQPPAAVVQPPPAVVQPPAAVVKPRPYTAQPFEPAVDSAVDLLTPQEAARLPSKQRKAWEYQRGSSPEGIAEVAEATAINGELDVMKYNGMRNRILDYRRGDSDVDRIMREAEESGDPISRELAQEAADSNAAMDKRVDIALEKLEAARNANTLPAPAGTAPGSVAPPAVAPAVGPKTIAQLNQEQERLFKLRNSLITKLNQKRTTTTQADTIYNHLLTVEERLAVVAAQIAQQTPVVTPPVTAAQQVLVTPPAATIEDAAEEVVETARRVGDDTQMPFEEWKEKRRIRISKAHEEKWERITKEELDAEYEAYSVRFASMIATKRTNHELAALLRHSTTQLPEVINLHDIPFGTYYYLWDDMDKARQISLATAITEYFPSSPLNIPPQRLFGAVNISDYKNLTEVPSTIFTEPNSLWPSYMDDAVSQQMKEATRLQMAIKRGELRRNPASVLDQGAFFDEGDNMVQETAEAFGGVNRKLLGATEMVLPDEVIGQSVANQKLAYRELLEESSRSVQQDGDVWRIIDKKTGNIIGDEMFTGEWQANQHIIETHGKDYTSGWLNVADEVPQTAEQAAEAAAETISAESVARALNVGPEVAEATVVLAQKMDLPLEDILFTRGGEAAQDALTQGEKAVIKGRSLEIQNGIQDLLAGKITKQEYNAIVQRYRPVAPVTEIPIPATNAEMLDSVNGVKSNSRGVVGKGLSIPSGKPISLRTDLPWKNKTGKSAVVVHAQDAGNKPGTVIAFEGSGRITNPQFITNEKEASKIALGQGRTPFASVKGNWSADQSIPADVQSWTQVGFDPTRHSFYYDKATMLPVESGSEAIQIGNTVFVKNAVFGNPASKLFQDAKGSMEILEGGKVLIRGFANSDVSTGVHELAHVARHFLFDINIPEAKRLGITNADIKVAETWSGVKNGVWETKHEEKFARGFERYMRDGNAPTDGLKRIFAKFEQWLNDIYKVLTDSAIDIEISPEMREVFDKLVTRSEFKRPSDAASDFMAGQRVPTPAAVSPATVSQGAPDLFKIPTSTIKVDPVRFQFKSGYDPITGATDKFRDVEKYNYDYAGTITLWEDINKNLFVIDGHHRVELAQRFNIGKMNAFIKRESEGFTEANARVHGAILNIQDNKGTPIDVAKFLRESGNTIESLKNSGVSVTANLVARGAALADLDTTLFYQVVIGKLSENAGVAIGHGLPKDFPNQIAVAKLVTKTKKEMNPNKIRILIERAKGESVTVTQTDMFGTTAEETSTLLAQVDLIDWLENKYGSDATLFRAVSKGTRPDELLTGGTIVDVERAKEIVQDSKTLLEVFRMKVKQVGPVNQIVRDSAAQVVKDGNSKEIYSTALNKIREVIASGDAIGAERFTGISGSATGEPLAVALQARPAAVAAEAVGAVPKAGNPLSLQKDGIEGYEISWEQVPNGNDAFQYAVGRTSITENESVFRRRANESGTYGGWRWEIDVNKIKPPARPAPAATDAAYRAHYIKTGVSPSLFEYANEKLAKRGLPALPPGTNPKSYAAQWRIDYPFVVEPTEAQLLARMEINAARAQVESAAQQADARKLKAKPPSSELYQQADPVNGKLTTLEQQALKHSRNLAYVKKAIELIKNNVIETPLQPAALAGAGEQQKLAQVFEQIKQRYSDLRRVADRVGTEYRDLMLFDYGQKFNFDRAMETVFAYPFWYLRHYSDYPRQIMTDPNYLVKMFQLGEMMKRNNEDKDLPDWMRHHLGVTMPEDSWLQDIFGEKTIYMPILSQLAPLQQLLDGNFVNAEREKNVVGQAYNRIYGWGLGPHSLVALTMGVANLAHGYLNNDEEAFNQGAQYFDYMGSITRIAPAISGKMESQGYRLPFAPSGGFSVDYLMMMAGALNFPASLGSPKGGILRGLMAVASGAHWYVTHTRTTDGIKYVGTVYDQRRVANILSEWRQTPGKIVNGIMLTPELIQDAAIVAKSPNEMGRRPEYQVALQVWSEAVTESRSRKFGATLLSFFGGPGVATRGIAEINSEKMYKKIQDTYDMVDDPRVSKEEYSEAWTKLGLEYPDISTYGIFKRFGDDAFDVYAKIGLGRVGLGAERRAVFESVGLDYKLVDKFYNAKGTTDAFTSNTELQQFREGIVRLNLLLKAPDMPTKLEWAEASRMYGRLMDELEASFPGTAEKQDAFFNLEGEARDQFLLDHLDLKARREMEVALMLNDPEYRRVLAPYYISISETENLVKSMYGQKDPQREAAYNILMENREDWSADKEKRFMKDFDLFAYDRGYKAMKKNLNSAVAYLLKDLNLPSPPTPRTDAGKLGGEYETRMTNNLASVATKTLERAALNNTVMTGGLGSGGGVAGGGMAGSPGGGTPRDKGSQSATLADWEENYSKTSVKATSYITEYRDPMIYQLIQPLLESLGNDPQALLNAFDAPLLQGKWNYLSDNIPLDKALVDFVKLQGAENLRGALMLNASGGWGLQNQTWTKVMGTVRGLSDAEVGRLMAQNPELRDLAMVRETLKGYGAPTLNALFDTIGAYVTVHEDGSVSIGAEIVRKPKPKPKGTGKKTDRFTTGDVGDYISKWSKEYFGDDIEALYDKYLSVAMVQGEQAARQFWMANPRLAKYQEFSEMIYKRYRDAKKGPQTDNMDFMDAVKMLKMVKEATGGSSGRTNKRFGIIQAMTKLISLASQIGGGGGGSGGYSKRSQPNGALYANTIAVIRSTNPNLANSFAELIQANKQRRNVILQANPDLARYITQFSNQQLVDMEDSFQASFQIGASNASSLGTGLRVYKQRGTRTGL